MPKINEYQITDSDFINTVKNCKNIHEALNKMGMNNKGAAYKIFRRRCKKLNLDISHFTSDKVIRKTITNEMICDAVNSNASRQATLQVLKLSYDTNVNVTWINKKIQELNLKTSHWLGQGHLKGKTHNWSVKISDSEIFIQDSKYLSTTGIKNRLIKNYQTTYKCLECNISEWNSKPISLQLEHKNGINTDNRIENLCFLCPNCHSQTSTFAGRNKNK